MSATETFWQNVEEYGNAIKAYQESSGITPNLSEACDGFCRALRRNEATRAVSDPRNMSRVRHIRTDCADQWSAINSRMEYIVAEEMCETCFSYADFCEQTANHWLLRESADLIRAELDLYASQNVDLAGKRVAMVGPGAIPYTGLALAAAGADVTLIDLYAPACKWSSIWMERFFPEGNWQVRETPGQNVDYAEFDLVIVASMLMGRDDVLRAIDATRPAHVLVRTTSGRRPMSLLLPQVPEAELALLNHAEFMAESNPPLHVGNIGLLYHHPQN